MFQLLYFLTFILSLVISFPSFAAPNSFHKININSNSNFLAEVYSELLGRTPQNSELKAFAALLAKDTTRAQVVQSLITSTEFRTDLIGDFYSQYLNRPVDEGSLAVFLELLSQGQSSEVVRGTILSSDEYFSTRGESNDTTFVNVLFNDLLGRSPTSSERANINQILRDPNSRDDVVALILDSNEYRLALVNAFYQDFLGRSAATIEQNTALANLENGQTLETLQATLLASDEFFLKVSKGFFAGNTFQGLLGMFSVTDGTLGEGDFSTIINWGDGKRSTGELVTIGNGEFGVNGSHAYKKGGTFDVQVVIKGKARISANLVLKIKNPLSSFKSIARGAKGLVRVAVGDVNGDGVDDVITGASAGGSSSVNVVSGLSGNLLQKFTAFDASFKGGVYVAAGDVNGDGLADIIVGADAGGSPQVKVFSGEDLSLLHSFFAFDSDFTGGVRVAAGDVTGDGLADIVTAAGTGSGPNVTIYNGVNGAVVQNFLAFNPTFTGGVYVAAGDVNGDGKADIITGAGAGGGPQVAVFDGESLASLFNFFAYAPTFSGGVRVAAGDVNGDGVADIITAPGAGGGPHVKVFDGTSLNPLKSFFAFSKSFKGGVFVAVGDINGTGTPGVVTGALVDKTSSIKFK